MNILLVIGFLGVIALFALTIMVNLEVLRGLETISKLLFAIYKNKSNLEDYYVREWPGAFVKSYYFYKKDDDHERQENQTK